MIATDLGLPAHADGPRAGSDLLTELVAKVEQPTWRGWYRSHDRDGFEIGVSPELRIPPFDLGSNR